jgi:hypothetical protein
MDAGLRSSSNYTVRETVEDWLRAGLDGTSDRTRTLYEGLLGLVLDAIGAQPLRTLSAGDVESIALLAGHDRTATTESVYRHEIRPALTQGAEVMDKIFGE